MARFPVSIAGQTYPDLTSLVLDLEDRGRNGTLDHPGQSQPADHFEPAYDDDAARQALGEAATLIVATATEPEVLRTAAIVGSGTRHLPFYASLLDRLEGIGPAIPAAHGLGSPTLRRDLVERLVSWVPARDPALARRARTFLRREGAWDVLVSFLAMGDPDGAMPDALIEVLDKGVPSYTLDTGMIVTVRQQRRRIPDVARALVARPEAVRRRFLDLTREHAADWFAESGDTLRVALGLGG